MTMKKQPEGVRRVRRGDDKPASEYDIFDGADNIGYTQRSGKSKWKAFPANADPTDLLADVPEHKDHTEAVQYLLDRHRGKVATTDTVTATEDASVAEHTGEQAVQPAVTEPVSDDATKREGDEDDSATPDEVADPPGEGGGASQPGPQPETPAQPDDYPTPSPGGVPQTNPAPQDAQPDVAEVPSPDREAQTAQPESDDPASPGWGATFPQGGSPEAAQVTVSDDPFAPAAGAKVPASVQAAADPFAGDPFASDPFGG